MVNEIWKSVVGYEGLYEVSDDGRVRGVRRTHTAVTRRGTRRGTLAVHTRKAKELRPYYDKDGYASVRLCRGNAATHSRVSRLVLAAFVGAALGREAGHLNNDTRDNRVGNLQWQTRAENEAQKNAHQRRPASTRGLFTAETVRVVRDMRASGFSLRDIAALFVCHVSTVGYVCAKTTWRYVDAT